MKITEESKDYWGNLIYTARMSPQNIKSKITSYMFENSISEIQMVDEFINHACFFVLNNHRKRILAQGIPSRKSESTGYEVFRFMHIFKFLFPNHIESENYKNFKHVSETGSAIEGACFSINLVGYSIYSATKYKEVGEVESNMAFTPELSEVFKVSSYAQSDVAQLAFEVIESVYNNIEELNRLRENLENHDQLQTLASSIVNSGSTNEEKLNMAVNDYNECFYSFIESIKTSKNKKLLRNMKDDILTYSFTVVNEEVKPEIVNYFKLV